MKSRMACKISSDFRLIDDEAGLEDALHELKREIIDNSRFIAVDCEGVNLSRKGALTIITVATEDKVYIFDVLKLQQAVFSFGFGEILEDKSIGKLMFDCREDSDALWHQFNIKLTGVLDLQLLEILYRRENDTATRHEPSSAGYTRRSHRPYEVESIYGFRRCLELYVQDDELIKMKNEGKILMKKDYGVWKKRPLSDELMEYCIVDTTAMFKLYEKMKDVKEREEARLRVASEKYADLYRQKSVRSFDDYDMNALLPLDIIPEKGKLYFPHANTECIKCLRRFPREEFSNTQLRNGEPKCRVCKEIKLKEDEERSRDIRDFHKFLRFEVFSRYSDDDFICGDSDDEYSVYW